MQGKAKRLDKSELWKQSGDVVEDTLWEAGLITLMTTVLDHFWVSLLELHLQLLVAWPGQYHVIIVGLRTGSSQGHKGHYLDRLTTS